MIEIVEPEGITRKKLFSIWSEGYACTGQSAGAYLHGCAYGFTFREACIQFFTIDKKNDHTKYFDAENLGYWGCRLFDNEVDARKAFG